jgi:hypothetical protein
MSNDPRLIGFTPLSSREAVSVFPLATCFVRPFPRNLFRSRAHPLSPSPLQSSFASTPRSSPFGASFTCLGLRPSSRHHPRAATLRVGSHRRRFAPSSGFRSLSTAFSALGLAGLFHPAATSRTSRSGASHPAQPPFLFGRSFPLAVAPPRAHRLSPAATRCGPRLRGLHPRKAAFDVARLFTPQHAAPLLGFISSRPSRPRSIAAYPRSPLTTLDRRAFAVRDRAPSPSSACLPKKPGFASLLRLPARAFEPSLQNLRARDPIPPRVAPRQVGSGRALRSRGCPREFELLPEHAPSWLPTSTRASRRISPRVLDIGTVASSARRCRPPVARTATLSSTSGPPSFPADLPVPRCSPRVVAPRDEFVSHALTAWLPTR